MEGPCTVTGSRRVHPCRSGFSRDQDPPVPRIPRTCSRLAALLQVPGATGLPEQLAPEPGAQGAHLPDEIDEVAVRAVTEQAVPDGVFARLGLASPWPVSQEAGSLFANILNYGVLGGFFLGEYVIRHRLFRDRPYRNFVDFIRQMGALGPGFWRELFR